MTKSKLLKERLKQIEAEIKEEEEVKQLEQKIKKKQFEKSKLGKAVKFLDKITK